MAKTKAMEEAPSLREQAYEKIKRMVITLSLKPGEYLNEARLTTSLKLGRTPVHQALSRLELEGMVEVIPRRGILVKPISLNEVVEVTDIRQVNEIHCVRLAAERADAGDLKELKRILARGEKFVAEGRVEALMDVDREFHGTIARAARNAVLADILGQLHDRSLRFWFVSLLTRDQHERVQSQHTKIVEALEAHNPDAAEAAMKAHVANFRRNVRASI